MKFGVIVCPKCKKVKGIDLSNKTTKCYGCGKVLTIQKLNVLYTTTSQEELKRAIGLVNARLDGKYNEFKDLFQTTD